MQIQLLEIKSPLGDLEVAFHDERVVGLEFADRRPRLQKFLRRRFGVVTFVKVKRLSPALRQVRDRVRDYFAGDIQALDRIDVDLGGTPFQKQVWQQLRRIRPGRTTSYGELARKVRRPQASRAVGAANGANPIALIVPCHRVIGSDGSLTGYAGGVDRKRWLLEHEAAAGPRP